MLKEPPEPLWIAMTTDLCGTVYLQGLNTLKYVVDADDDVFDVEGGESSPILSLVSNYDTRRLFPVKRNVRATTRSFAYNI